MYLLADSRWGITDIVKMQAVRFSQQGFRVFVADLYTHTKLSKEKGTTTAADREQAGHCMNTLVRKSRWQAGCFAGGFFGAMGEVWPCPNRKFD